MNVMKKLSKIAGIGIVILGSYHLLSNPPQKDTRGIAYQMPAKITFVSNDTQKLYAEDIHGNTYSFGSDMVDGMVPCKDASVTLEFENDGTLVQIDN